MMQNVIDRSYTQLESSFQQKHLIGLRIEVHLSSSNPFEVPVDPHPWREVRMNLKSIGGKRNMGEDDMISRRLVDTTKTPTRSALSNNCWLMHSCKHESAFLDYVAMLSCSLWPHGSA
jgi:hypothetical protein